MSHTHGQTSLREGGPHPIPQGEGARQGWPPSSSWPPSKGLFAEQRGTEDMYTNCPTTSLPSSPDHWEVGQFLQSQATPIHISNPPAQVHTQPHSSLGLQPGLMIHSALLSRQPGLSCPSWGWGWCTDRAQKDKQSRLVTLPRAVPSKG